MLLSIIAIHGLNGDREETWSTGGVNWLREFLPDDVPNARILSYGYNSRTHGSRFQSQSLYEYGKSFLDALCTFWKRTEVTLGDPHVLHMNLLTETNRLKLGPSSSLRIVWVALSPRVYVPQTEMQSEGPLWHDRLIGVITIRFEQGRRS